MGKIFTLTAPVLTRPADTTQYAAGDLVANSVTAGSVVKLVFPRNKLQGRTSGKILGGSLKKSTVAVTTASFRLHLFTADPGAVTNGDNGAIVVASVGNYIGFLDFNFATLTADGNIAGAALLKAATAPATPIGFSLLGGGTLYGLIEATGAYTPASGETFTATLDVEA